LVLPRWHFVPTATNVQHDPVYTYEVFTHTAILIHGYGPAHDDNRRDKQLTDEIKAKCEMTDFPQQVQAFIKSQQADSKP
jgi:hypothetical protein